MRELTRKELSALKPGTLIKIEGYPEIFRGLAVFEEYADDDREITCFPIGDYSDEIVSDSRIVTLLDDDVVLLPSAGDIGVLQAVLKISQFMAQEGGAA